MNPNDGYSLDENKSANDLKNVFVSKGKKDIVKAIEYTYVQDVNDSITYNLGFGDYNTENDEVDDESNANNGDMYKVFNTVLSTIPIFFENNKGGVIFVQGSDGVPGFAEKCRLACTKKCGGDECKNLNRRINTYRYYINKNYDQLSADYQFSGGTMGDNNEISYEAYVPFKGYDSIAVKKK